MCAVSPQLMDAPPPDLPPSRPPRDAPLRVLHFPDNDGGHPGGLSSAERMIGLDSQLVTLAPHPFGYPADRILDDRPLGRVGRVRRRVAATLELAQAFDVFHFNGGQSFLPASLPFTFDISLLQRLGKPVFVTYLGSDARPASSHRDPTLMNRGVPARWSEHVKRVRTQAVGRRADGVFCVNPDLLAAVPGSEFVPYAAVDIASVETAPPRPRSKSLRVVHAPSHRDIKGTRHVLAAVAELRDVLDIELDLVENVPHAEAMRRYRRADVVVDQVEIGWYGTLAVECMAMAKPVIARLRSEDVARIPAAMAAEVPVVSASPSELADCLRSFPSRDLAELGRQGRAYVERWHDPTQIARRMQRLYLAAVAGREGRQSEHRSPTFWSPLN